MEAAAPTRQPRGHERVERILRATLAVIGREGVGAVTHRSVAEAADVPLGSLTYYFASKQELLRDALRLFVAEDVARLHGMAERLAAERAAPEELVDRFAAVLEATDPEHLAQFGLYLAAAHDPELRDVAAESLAAYGRVAVVALRAAGVPEPERAAAVVVAAVDGLGLQRIAAGDRAPDLRAALGRLLRALSAPCAP